MKTKNKTEIAAMDADVKLKRKRKRSQADDNDETVVTKKKCKHKLKKKLRAEQASPAEEDAGSLDKQTKIKLKKQRKKQCTESSASSSMVEEQEHQDSSVHLVNVTDEHPTNTDDARAHQNNETNESVGEVEKPSSTSDLADVPLGDLLKMRESLNAKLYNRVVFGNRKDVKDDTFETSADQPSTSDRGDDNAAPAPSKQASSKNKPDVGTEPKMKRIKKRPREESSKQKPARTRIVFDLDSNEKQAYNNHGSGGGGRDPRFDSRCGDYNEFIHNQNYEFVKDLRSEEKKLLKKLYRSVEDMVERKRMKQAIKRIEDQERSDRHKQQTKERLKQLRFENQERLKRGEKPIFLSRAQLREREQREKYAELKSTNKLDSYLKRTEKKMSKKQDRHQKRPNERR